jgi:hypothetical protein
VIALRVLVAVLAAAALLTVLSSVLRTLVLPRAIPARLARVAFLSVRAVLRLRLRVSRRSDYETRDRIFALQAPLGLFAQLAIWAMLIFLCFAALFWAISAPSLAASRIPSALEQAGSSMLTLGFDAPHGLGRQLAGFAAAAIGLTVLALMITYLPSLYAAFSRREAVITKLVVRTGIPPSGATVLERSWSLGRFEQLDEVWESWEDWFIELGETHTTFPQLAFFRSPHPHNHWVLAAESVLDGAALLMTVCDVPRQSRAELCVDAGVNALTQIADYLGIPHEPPDEDAEIELPDERFDQAREELAELDVPIRDDRDRAWREFRDIRARYEPLLAVLGATTDAPRSNWSSWSDDTPRHSPPVLRATKPTDAPPVRERFRRNKRLRRD